MLNIFQSSIIFQKALTKKQLKVIFVILQAKSVQ